MTLAGHAGHPGSLAHTRVPMAKRCRGPNNQIHTRECATSTEGTVHTRLAFVFVAAALSGTGATGFSTREAALGLHAAALVFGALRIFCWLCAKPRSALHRFFAVTFLAPLDLTTRLGEIEVPKRNLIGETQDD